jgi:hypothetical protein
MVLFDSKLTKISENQSKTAVKFVTLLYFSSATTISSAAA